MPPVSLKIFICLLRKKFITKVKLDTQKFQTFHSKNCYIHKNRDVYPSSKQKGARLINLRARTHIYAPELKFPKQ